MVAAFDWREWFNAYTASWTDVSEHQGIGCGLASYVR